MFMYEHGYLARERTNGCRIILVRYLVRMCQSPKVQVVAAHSLVCIHTHPRHEGMGTLRIAMYPFRYKAILCPLTGLAWHINIEDVSCRLGGIL